jgi:serine/threonine protein kinase
MNATITTWVENPALEEAFAAYLQAQENGDPQEAERILQEHPGLADEIAAFFAFRARVPKPWRGNGDALEGRRVGDLELLQELGRGGMGVVYKARDVRLNRVVAVKVMRQERFADAEDAERFRRDAELLASLHHPNIVQIYQAGEAESGPYFAMELVEGGSLAHKRAEGWLPTPLQAAELVRALAEAIQHAHNAGVVHRDLKPANVLLASNPSDPTTHHSPLTTHQPKITDFGLAKKLDASTSLTGTGVIVGTASYMAPEQAAGDSKHVGPAADIYALGAILYELLTGRPPFVGATLVETLEQVRAGEPWLVRQLCPTAPRELETICLKCLSKNPKDRYASARELADELHGFVNGRPIKTHPIGLLQRLARTVNQTGLIADYHNYSVSYFVSGFVYLTLYSAVFFLARWDGPEWLIWLAMFAPATVLFRIFRQHRYPWNGVVTWIPDRLLWSIWIGHFLTDLTLFAAIRFSGRTLAETVEISFIIKAALTGMAFFIMGSDYWGRYYLYGLGWMAAAALMVFVPAWGPLIFAFGAAVCAWYVAWSMRQLQRARQQPPAIESDTVSHLRAKN